MALLSLSPSTKSINSISSTVLNMKRSLSNTRTVISDTKKIILNRTKIKTQAVFTSKSLFQKRRDAIIKKEAEDQLEASNLASVLSPGFATEKSILNAGKGFLGRILSAIAYLGVGWLLKNLPTWIGMAKEFVARIYKGVSIVATFVKGAIGFVGNMFNLLSSVAQNIASFDFFDTSNRVKDTFGQLNQNLSDMSSSIDDALKLMTTSLSEGIASGQDAPPLGSEGPSQFPESQPSTSSGTGLNGTAYGVNLKALATATGAAEGNYDSVGVTVRGGGHGLGRYQFMTYRSDTTAIIRKNAKAMGEEAIAEDLLKRANGSDRNAARKLLKYFPAKDQDSLFSEHATNTLTQIKRKYRDASVEFLVKRFGAAHISGSFEDLTSPDALGTTGAMHGNKIWKEYQKASSSSSQAQVSSSQQSSPTNLNVSSTSKGNFIQGSTGKSTGPHFHFGPGTADSKLAQQGDKFPGTYYSDVRAVAFTVAKHFLSQKKSFSLTRSNRNISPGISDNDLQNALLNEQKVHTRNGSDGGIDMAFAETVRMPLSVADVKFRDDGFGISGTVAGTNVFVGHGAMGSKSDSFTGSQSMDISTITPNTSGDVVSVVDTRPAIDMQALSQLLNATAASFNSSGMSQIDQTPQTSEFNMLNNFIKQKFLTDLAYL